MIGNSTDVPTEYAWYHGMKRQRISFSCVRFTAVPKSGRPKAIIATNPQAARPMLMYHSDPMPQLMAASASKPTPATEGSADTRRFNSDDFGSVFKPHRPVGTDGSSALAVERLSVGRNPFMYD